ncbi:MAG: dienelactone hydrolase family protein [Candidatus Sumerlaeota bacterium]|nr:dienelactone hydrolase family protein [Candidatus Sumerlaeota bacterium]
MRLILGAIQVFSLLMLIMFLPQIYAADASPNTAAGAPAVANAVATSSSIITIPSFLHLLKNRSTTDVLVYEFEGQPPRGMLEGIVIRPADKSGCPFIVVNHGATNQPIDKAMEVGPHLARRGYVTVTPRYTHSGPKPGATTKPERDWDVDVELCIGAARFARTLPFVSGRGGVTGISAGGFTIIDMLPGANPYSSAIVVSAGLEDPAPSNTTLKGFRIPVLIMTGTKDDVIPPTWGGNLYQALLNGRRKVKLISYDGGPHDLFNWQGRRVSNEMADWFDETLKK